MDFSFSSNNRKRNTNKNYFFLAFFSFRFAFLRSVLWDWEYSWHSYIAEVEVYLEKNKRESKKQHEVSRKSISLKLETRKKSARSNRQSVEIGY